MRRFSVLALAVTAVCLAQSPAGMIAPRLLSRVEPEYSDEARQARIGASVVLKAFSDAGKGSGTSIRLDVTPGKGYAGHVTDTFQSWRFAIRTHEAGFGSARSSLRN